MKPYHIYRFVLTYALFIAEATGNLCSSSDPEVDVIDICFPTVIKRNKVLFTVSSRQVCQCIFSSKVTTSPAFRLVNRSNVSMRQTQCGIDIIFTMDEELRWNVTCNTEINQRYSYPLQYDQAILITTVIRNITGNDNTTFCIELKLSNMLYFMLECGNGTVTANSKASYNNLQNITAKDDKPRSVYPVVGGTIGALVIVLLLITALIVYRRKNIKEKTRLQQQEKQRNEPEDDELKYNVLYQSAVSNDTDSINKNEQSQYIKRSVVYKDSYDDATSSEVGKSMSSLSKTQKPKIFHQLDLKEQNIPYPNKHTNNEDVVEHITAPGIAGCEYAVVNKTGSRKVSVDISSSVSNDTSSEYPNNNVDLKENNAMAGNDSDNLPSKKKKQSLHYEEVEFQ